MKLILLVDDSAEIRLTFRVVLRAAGYRVIESESGKDGLEIARQHKPDLILTDINMPGGDGQTLLQQIRTDADLCSIQVVLMTGRPDLVSPRKGMEQGADDFLVKPINREALLACVASRVSRADIHWRVEDQALSKLRSSMTSQLPHEFFTPLAGIIGLSEILGEEAAQLSTSEIQDLCKDIHQSGRRLHRTLRNYLRILEEPAESEAEARAASLAPTELKDSVKAAVDAVIERHGRREDLVADWKEAPLRVEGTDLSLIVEELLDNAFKFSGRRSRVIARLDEKGVLEIADAVRGMLKEEIQKIGAFRQFDRKKYEHQGLGLGLCLVQKLATRNGAAFILRPGDQQGVIARVEFQIGTPVMPRN